MSAAEYEMARLRHIIVDQEQTIARLRDKIALLEASAHQEPTITKRIAARRVAP